MTKRSGGLFVLTVGFVGAAACGRHDAAPAAAPVRTELREGMTIASSSVRARAIIETLRARSLSASAAPTLAGGSAEARESALLPSGQADRFRVTADGLVPEYGAAAGKASADVRLPA